MNYNLIAVDETLFKKPYCYDLFVEEPFSKAKEKGDSFHGDTNIL